MLVYNNHLLFSVHGMNIKVLCVVSYWRGLRLWMVCHRFPPWHVFRFNCCKMSVCWTAK